MITEVENRPAVGVDLLQVPRQRPECVVQVVESTSEFDSLEAEWDSLFEESGVSVFQSFEWQRLWWKYFGEGNRCAHLYIIVIKCGGKALAIAPFFIETVRLLEFSKLHTISFIGREVSDYLTVLAARGYESLCANLIASHLAEHSSMFEALCLEDIPDRSRMHLVLYEALARAGFNGELFIDQYCPRAPLQDTWEETVSSLCGTHRRHLNQRRRQISENFVTQFEVTRRENDISRDMDDFIALHQKRWIKNGCKGVFSNQRMVAFHHEVAARFFQRGWLFLAFLRLDGKRVAAVYGFRFRRELEYYLGGIEEDGKAGPYSPGTVLHSYSMEQAIEEGKRVYDFLRGTEQYKSTLGAVETPNWTILMFCSRSETIRFRFRMQRFLTKVGRRVDEEKVLMRHVLAESGTTLSGLAKHIWKRGLKNLADIRRRVAPLSSRYLCGYPHKSRPGNGLSSRNGSNGNGHTIQPVNNDFFYGAH